MFLKVRKSNIVDDSEPELRLDELDFEYCLPRWFWTKFEWSKYMLHRRKIIKEIEERDSEYNN